MKQCPYCAESIQDAAIKCRYCGSRLGDSLSSEWYRLREGKMVAGVCAGLALATKETAAPILLAVVGPAAPIGRPGRAGVGPM